MASDSHASTPIDDLGILAKDHVVIGDSSVEHHEMYTREGLFSLMWHPADGDERAVIMCGGAMGGTLGGGGLYHQLGEQLAGRGIAAVRVGYRVPNDLGRCTHDLLAAMQLMARRGARRFVTIGHSFGGAVAIQTAAAMHAELVPGVVTLATQSAGCEPVETLGDRSLLFFHGTHDQILPAASSQMVHMLAGHGELVMLPGEDHLLQGARDEIAERLLVWLPDVLRAAEPTDNVPDDPSA